jgi:hypothetical protein
MKKLTELEQLAVDCFLPHPRAFERDALRKLAFLGKELSQSQKKVIDMSPMIDSGLLCDLRHEFVHREMPPLSCVISSDFFDEHRRLWEKCTPLLNYWYASPEGWNKCPIPEGFEIEYFDVDNGIRTSIGYKRWNIHGWNDVRMFRIIRKLDDYIYSWEQEQ